MIFQHVIKHTIIIIIHYILNNKYIHIYKSSFLKILMSLSYIVCLGNWHYWQTIIVMLKLVSLEWSNMYIQSQSNFNKFPLNRKQEVYVYSLKFDSGSYHFFLDLKLTHSGQKHWVKTFTLYSNKSLASRCAFLNLLYGIVGSWSKLKFR